MGRSCRDTELMCSKKHDCKYADVWMAIKVGLIVPVVVATDSRTTQSAICNSHCLDHLFGLYYGTAELFTINHHTVISIHA